MKTRMQALANDAAYAMPQREGWTVGGNAFRSMSGGAMCSVGPANITGVATGSRNGLASESVPPLTLTDLSPTCDGTESFHWLQDWLTR